MKCREAKALADEYLGKSLDEETRARVESHLEVCELCRREYEEVRRYREAAAGLPRVKVPEDFLGGIHERLGEEAGRKRVWELLFQPLSRKLPIGIAALAVAVFAFIFVFHSLRPKIEEYPEHAPVYRAAPESRAAAKKKTAGGEIKSRSEAREDAVESSAEDARPVEAARPVEDARPAEAASSAEAASPAEQAREQKKAEAGAKSAPQEPARPAPPLEIAVALERPLSQAGAARGLEAVPRSGAAFDTEVVPDTQAGPDTKAAFDAEASSAGGSRATGAPAATRKSKAEKPSVEKFGDTGETTDTRLKRVRGELVRTIEDAGGTVISSEAREETSTTLAVVPSSGLRALLDYLGKIGQIKTDRALALPGPEAQGERVELRIRLTYSPQEDSGENTGIR